MQTILKPTLIIALIAFAASMALSHINKVTLQRIKERELQKKEEALKIVLPGYTIVEKDKVLQVEGKDFRYSRAEKQVDKDVVSAYAFETEKAGYSGLIKSVIGVDENMKILGMAIIQQSETPGLGARSVEIASKETFFGHFFGSSAAGTGEVLTPWFQEQFKGLDLSRKIGIMKKGEWRSENEALKKELLESNSVSAITGATITTKAVRDSLEIKTEILKKLIQMETEKRKEDKKKK